MHVGPAVQPAPKIQQPGIEERLAETPAGRRCQAVRLRLVRGGEQECPGVTCRERSPRRDRFALSLRDALPADEPATAGLKAA